MPISRIGLTGKASGIWDSPTQLIDTSLDSVLPASAVRGRSLNEGLQLLAADDNPDTVYIGYINAIDANGSAVTGFPLAPGASLFVPCRKTTDLWVISAGGVSTNNIFFIGA